MMYRKTLEKQEIYLVNDMGGIGDIIAQLPVVKWIHDNHPHVYITYWLASFMKTVAKKSLPISDRLIIRSFDEKSEAKVNIPVRKISGSMYTNLARHMTVHAFEIFANTVPDDLKAFNYLPINTKGVYINRFNLPEKYVIVTCGFTAPVREFLPEVVNEVVRYIVQKGYVPVFLGREVTKENSDESRIIKGSFSQEIDYSVGINLINKTDMLESTKIISESRTIVGLDNGLLHLAATTDVPIVGGFSTVNPKHRLPYRHGVEGWNYYSVELNSQELPCNQCQSNMTFSFNHNFTKCFYNDYKCLGMLDAGRYIEQLEKIL